MCSADGKNCTTPSISSLFSGNKAHPGGDTSSTAPSTMESDGETTIRENACDSLLMCIVTTMNKGLRSGGGIGDVLRSPSRGVSLFFSRSFVPNHKVDVFPLLLHEILAEVKLI